MLDPLALAEPTKPTPMESARIMRDLGLGCGAMLVGLAAVLAILVLAVA